MVIDNHRFRWKVGNSCPEIAEEMSPFFFQISRSHSLPDPHAEPDSRTQHRVAEDRAGSYAVCIMVCKEFDELLPADLFCDCFCYGIE
jgi:hypothetical protein